MVHPGKTLRRLVSKICEHWEIGYGSTYNPNRKDALSLVNILPNLEDVILSIEERSGKPPLVITTSAQKLENTVSFKQARQEILLSDREILVLLGTGWGLVKEVHQAADLVLDPVEGWTDYNHLSVRGAAAISLDRLFGKES